MQYQNPMHLAAYENMCCSKIVDRPRNVFQCVVPRSLMHPYVLVPLFTFCRCYNSRAGQLGNGSEHLFGNTGNEATNPSKICYLLDP
jgi:hypothetical protein